MLDHILVPLDGSLLAERALPHAAALAQIVAGRVTVLRVLETSGSSPCDPVARAVEHDEARRYLDGIVDRIARSGVRATAQVLEGGPATTILGYLHDQRVDLVVLSSHGRSGLLGWNLGSVGRKLLEHARVHLLLVRAFVTGAADAADAPLRYRRLLLPLDGSHRAECALPVACRIADAHGAQIVLAHAVPHPAMVRQMPLAAEEVELAERVVARNRAHADRYLTELRDELLHAGRDAVVRIVAGDPPIEALHELPGAIDADLVILSAHGAGGSTRRPFGRTAVDLLAYLDVSTLVVQDRDADEIEPSAAERAAGERTGHG